MNKIEATEQLKKDLMELGFGEKLASKKSNSISGMWVPGNNFSLEYIKKIASRELRDEISEFGKIRDDSTIKTTVSVFPSIVKHS
jgi:hypothetical protein